MIKRFLLFILAIIFLYSCSIFESYEKEEIEFTSGDITLSGTLILPEGEGPFPLIIFVHGSGPETRDNSFYSANWLASIGYAAFLYDKRGAGESGGAKEDISYFSFENLSDDVVAVIDTLSKMKKIDKSNIGIHASSQGGWVAPLAAAKSDLIKFMIIRAPSVVSVSEDRVFERGERLKGEGFTESDLHGVREMQLLEGKAKNDSGYDVFNQLYTDYQPKKWFPSVYGNATLKDLDEYRDWYATIAEFDPVIYLKRINIPIVWLFGDPQKDKLGPIENSIQNLESLRRAGKNYTILQYDGEGHNISESAYEKDLFNWLMKTNQYTIYDFKSH